MAGEELAPGLLTYVVPKGDAEKLTVGKVASIKDTRGDQAHGVVTRVEHGTQMSIVVLEAPCGSSSASSPESC